MLVQIVLEFLELAVGDDKGVTDVLQDRIICGEVPNFVDYMNSSERIFLATAKGANCRGRPLGLTRKATDGRL